MITQDVTTTGNLFRAELDGFTAFFELLSQIDQRLLKEDPEYRNKYYPGEEVRDKGKNANK